MVAEWIGVFALAAAGVVAGHQVRQWWLNRNATAYYYAGSGLTKSGDKFQPEAYTMAVESEEMMDHWYKLEFAGKEVYVYANDIMPKKDHDGRVIDLSPGAFQKLAPLSRGKIEGVLIKKL